MSAIAIIGAGLSGIVAANGLRDVADVTVFDKSRGVAGRMSTRRTDSFEFDHGAQYFTARDPQFKAAVNHAVLAGHVAPWNGKAVYHKDGKYEPDTGGQRYVSTPRMNSWAKTMAEGLNVKTSHRATHVSREADRWSVHFDGQNTAHGFDWIIMAAPAPQVVVTLPSYVSFADDLAKVQMQPCFALMLGLKSLPNVDWQTLRDEDGPASWIAINSAKPGRPNARPTLMVHAGPAWSQAHVDADKDDIAAHMLRATQAVMDIEPSDIDYQTVHRWLYASVLRGAGQDSLVDLESQLAACGDWCPGGRVEGAYISGLSVAERIKAALQT